MIGLTLGQYRVIEALGQGGMGTVYLAEDTQLGRRVAIKVISGAPHTEPAARARFLQEARAASALDHPNICAIYQIGETDEGAPFLVMAHYDGETLDRRISAGPMRLGEAVKLAAQVADGLAHAHARGVIHRDIKPSNVLRTSDGVAKILDFGLAKVIGAESMTVTGVSVGTPSYMSPEQVRAETVDARSDVWAVGVLLYALLAGRSPFEAENLGAVSYAILEGQPRPLRDLFPRVPDGLQEIVDRCLAKEPADRYPDARALAADLHRLADQLTSDDAHTMVSESATSGMQTLRVPSTPRRSAAMDSRRSRLPLVVGGIVLVIALATGVIAWVRAHPKPPLRVAVLATEVIGEPDSVAAAVAGSDATASLLRALGALRDIAPLDGSALRGVQGWRQTMSALSADEALTVQLTRAGEDWQVALRRLSAADSTVLWAATFPVARGASLTFLDATRANMVRAFPRHPLRPGEGESRIDPASYERYVELSRLYRRNFGSSVPPEEMRSRLETLRRAAPDFLDVHLLEALWAAYRFETGHAPEDIALAEEAGNRAARLAPEDPRVLRASIDILILKGDWEGAERTLESLRRLNPSDPEVTFSAARIEEGRGRRAEAIASLEGLVRRRPARVYLERLARMQYNAGRYDEARNVLAGLAASYPGYVFPRSYRAQLELLYGAPASAESLYASLAADYQQGSYLTNLALARMLLRKYPEAATAAREAVRLSPDETSMLLNLADCEFLLGRTEEALAGYRRVLEALKSQPENWETRLVAAQCLSHLGRTEEAVATAIDALRTESDNSDALFQAALVCAVSGESASAIIHTRRAIELGIQPRWFELPWFDSIRRDPRFEEAIRSRPGTGA